MGRRKKQSDIEDAIDEGYRRMQEAEMPQPPPPLGHNGDPVELTDDQKRALFFIHKKDYQDALATKKAADAAFRNVCKLAKAECGGNAVADIELAIRLENDGHDGVQAEIERMHRVARWMALPVGAEPVLFDSMVPAEDVAYARGKCAGLAGAVCNPGYAPELPQYQSYMKGFHDGNGVLALGGFRKLGDVAAEVAHTDVSNPPFNATDIPAAPAAP